MTIICQGVHLEEMSLEGAIRIGCRRVSDDIINLLLWLSSNNMVELVVANGYVLQVELRLTRTQEASWQGR